MMYGAHPAIEGLHALRDSLGIIVGRDCRLDQTIGIVRAYFRLLPRVAGMHTPRSLFNAHAGMRSFMLFPPNKITAYLDWKAQEVAVAAANSGDLQLMHDYAGDIYHALAVMCGLTKDTDIAHWRSTKKGKLHATV